MIHWKAQIYTLFLDTKWSSSLILNLHYIYVLSCEIVTLNIYCAGAMHEMEMFIAW